MKRHEWCVYGTFVSFRLIQFMMSSPIISLVESLKWITMRTFSEVATYFRGAVKVFELVQSSRDAMRFLTCTDCSWLRVVEVYVVIRG